jgi:two-component system response regulator ResD
MKRRKQGTPRVLVVDDDERLMMAITQVLHDAGYETRTSYDGQLAIQRLSMGYSPDVIVLDLVMPRVNGFEVLNWLRQHDLQIPIVLATSDDVRATDVGAVVKLAKPFTQEELLAAVANALRTTGQGG